VGKRQPGSEAFHQAPQTLLPVFYLFSCPQHETLTLLSSVQVVLAEKCHPLKDLPANPNNPKGLAILSDAFWDGCAFSASTGTSQDCRVVGRPGQWWCLKVATGIRIALGARLITGHE
jgi:hypothetical protein